MSTPTNSKIDILADLWINYRQDEQFQDFIEYNDLGLPLAYAISYKIVDTSTMAEKFIEETFALLLSALEIPEDEGYETLEDILGFE